MSRTRIPCSVTLFVATVVIALAAHGADNKKKSNKQNEQKRRENQARLQVLEHQESVLRQQIRSLEKQIPQLKKKLQSAQKTLQGMTGQARMARQHLEDAKTETKRMSGEHQRVAERVIADQPADSPFGNLRAKCEGAREHYGDAVDTVKESDAYKKATSALVRKQVLDKDASVLAARELLMGLQKEFERARLEVLRKDANWVNSMNDLKATKEQERRVDDQTKAVLGQYATALREVNSTKSRIAKMESELQQNRSELNQVVNAKQNIKRQLGGDQNKKTRNKKKR